MVTDRERRMVKLLVRLRIWHLSMQMRLPAISARCGSQWLLNWLRRRQVVDDFHHAPCCPANHYHRMRLVFGYCTCGAARAAHPTGGSTQ